MLLKVNEIKEMSNAEIIAQVFYMGILMSGDNGTNQDEESLKRLYKELGKRNIVPDWEEAYRKTNI